MPPLQISCRSSTYLLSYNPLLGLLFSYFSNPISRPSPFSSSSASSSSSSSSPWFSILRTALATNNLLLGKSAHACIIKSVQISDRFLSNNLINMYSKCGSPSYARNVFDITPDRDLVTWNSILAAYALSAEFEVYFIQEGFNLFRLLLGFGVPTSRLTLAPVLKLCLFSGYAWASEAVHGYALKIGLEWDAFVSGALVNIYLKFGRTKNARLLFDEMQERDVVLWNLMLKAYVQMGLGKEMFSLFSEFHRSGLGPDDASVHCVLSGTNEYNSEEARKFMEQVHAYAVKLNLYDDIDNSDVISWNKTMSHYLQDGETLAALECFIHFRRLHVDYDSVTLVIVLAAVAITKDLCLGKQVHGMTLKSGFESAVSVANSLINMYAKVGCVHFARNVFTKMEELDLISWNSMISCCAQSNLEEESVNLYVNLLRDGLRPDQFTLASVLRACSSLTEDLFLSEQIHVHALKTGVLTDNFVSTALIDVYSRGGKMEEADFFFQKQRQL